MPPLATTPAITAKTQTLDHALFGTFDDCKQSPPPQTPLLSSVTDDSRPVTQQLDFGPNSSLAWAVLASPANLLADGHAPSWLVRVRPFLGGHFAARNLNVSLGRPGLLLQDIGRRRLLMIFRSSASKKTHKAMVDRRTRRDVLRHGMLESRMAERGSPLVGDAVPVLDG